MNGRTVLIAGAGIAGSTLAYWLARNGFRPTVVERSSGTRSSGSPVDVRGRAAVIAERMGVMTRLRAVDTGVTDLVFVNAAGKTVGRSVTRPSADGPELEVARGDLARILYEASRDDAEYLFHDSVVALDQDEHGVDVTFGAAPPRRFDLVIGADGLHSGVRGLAFGPESKFVRHLGLYVATTAFDGPIDHPHDVVLFNMPGRALALHPGGGKPIAAFMFRREAVPDFDHRDTERHKRLLADAYSADRWRVPEAIRSVAAATDLYFDSVSKVRAPRWSRGRVALVGDAASCVSLFGDGSTLALIGAHTLAEELGASGGDHTAAFQRYERAQRVLTGPRQRTFALGAAWLVPATRAGIAARNTASRVLSRWSVSPSSRATSAR